MYVLNDSPDETVPDRLIPVPGCWVRKRATERPTGRVLRNRTIGSDVHVEVIWQERTHEWLSPDQLTSGFRAGWTVQDVPVSATRRSLGLGTVIGRRTIGHRQQLLVQLQDDGRCVWLPYENLRRVKDVRMRYTRAELGVNDHIQRCRLRLLAHALENWNHLTGSLDRLDVDPLPHQIQLVHRIVSSGNYNWLIADDVGLGKTIEVGLLLAALKRKGQARRVLIVTPSGLVRQWQDEMKYKFNEDYLIYGRDFVVNRPEHWRLTNHVIVSIDVAKRDNHLAMFRQADHWDIVIFDEAHKLSRYASGERTDRYRVAETLRKKTDALILLTGTPHQGYHDRFVALLDLVRPDLRRQIHTVEANPEIVSKLILRNRKSDVTDVDGNFIFKGQIIHRVRVNLSDEMYRFDALLKTYLRKGYKAGDKKRGAAGRAIGFVMTTYRKLASSSIAAIERALRTRIRRITSDTVVIGEHRSSAITLDDLAEGGDDHDDLDSVNSPSTGEFFDSEIVMIQRLLDLARAVRRNDVKLKTFLDDVVSPLVSEGKKLLIFTEYRGTQTYLQKALEQYFPAAGRVALINGSMKLEEKLEAIDDFNKDASFMVSTEAGGEGINLHQSCHVMVNYDLPWNPARLVQRIGRLYRYGQKDTVVVFNLHARDGFDNTVIDLLLNRVSRIAHDMAAIGGEFHERLYADILGDILDHLDLATILRAATTMRMEHTKEQVEAALARARRAQDLQNEIFANVAGYDPNVLAGTVGFTMQHVAHFVRNMLPLVGVTIEASIHRGQVLRVRLPDDMVGDFGEFGQKRLVRITTDRRHAQRLGDVVLLDFASSFFRYLVEIAKSQGFDGIYASGGALDNRNYALAAFKLRWQNDQGDLLTEEFVFLLRNDRGRIEKNPSFLVQWLLDDSEGLPAPYGDISSRMEVFSQLESSADELLLCESSRYKHPNGLVQLAAADLGGTNTTASR